MKILFLCKYNVFRSKIAESYFNRINKNKKIKAISRGFIMGGAPDNIQKKAAEKFGAEIRGTQKPVRLNELIEADKIIVVADDILKIMFNYQLSPIKKKVEIWKVKDEQKQNKKKAERIIQQIIKKVKRLVNTLEKRK